ncbi:tetratricopeptide repeat protein [Ktedonosporobacter rubrisoli]|uniref:Tetratricopeptide repeat protein n=1 Tax=Ktedonosporobacter rubrisoli TaxID=2509675 RepID=A0A4P6JK37_KTERU|nr:protein kinase [Ktedonosporobacter rubrisoli]QBD75322.1 tetratricopeptide repeat protein [Ktedonosporobacter rubrisoli]
MKDDLDSQIPADWQRGDRILTHHEIMYALGEGRKGVVYKVHHHGWGVDLAARALKADLLAEPGMRESFLHEIQSWVQLGLHPNIVQCYYVQTLKTGPWIFTEYVDGGSLAEWIRNHRLYAGGQQQALEHILDVAIQFAWGLHAAHEQGLLHLDVKPANVLLTAERVVKVTDFCLARLPVISGERKSSGKAQKEQIGTRAYCSPEQAAKRTLSRKADMWSWAVSILHLFAGNVTWQRGAAARNVLEDYLQQGLVHPSIPLMPDALASLLRQCLQERVEARPASMLEVANRLLDIYKHVVGSAYFGSYLSPFAFLADHLNNRAVALTDLEAPAAEPQAAPTDDPATSENASPAAHVGRVAIAPASRQTTYASSRQMWQQALEADPNHIEAYYNLGLLSWRQAGQSDEALIQHLSGVAIPEYKRGQLGCMLAQIYLEQDNPTAALTLLKDIDEQFPENAGVQRLLEIAQHYMKLRREHLRALRSEAESFIDVSRDGKFALSLERYVQPAHPEPAQGGERSPALSPSGSSRPNRSAEFALGIWNVEMGRKLHKVSVHSQSLPGSISPDGRFVLYPHQSGMLRLWKIATGRDLRILPTSGFWAASWSYDGRLLLISDADGAAQLWEVEKGQCLATLDWQGKAMGLSGDGSLAAGYAEEGIVLWEVSTASIRDHLPETAQVTALDLSSSGDLLFVANAQGELKLWDVAAGQCLQCIQVSGQIQAISLSSCGKWACSRDERGITRLWELASGRCLRTFAPGWSGKMLDDDFIALLGSEIMLIRRLYAMTFAGTLQLARLTVSAEAARVEMQARSLLYQAGMALCNSQFAEALKALQTVRALPGYERSPAYIEAWQQLARFCQRRSLLTHRLLQTLDERGPSSALDHSGSIKAACLSSDGQLAFSMRMDNEIHIWDMKKGKKIKTCVHDEMGHWDSKLALSLSGNGQLFLSSREDGNLRLWHVKSGQCLQTIGDAEKVLAISLSFEGRFAFAGHADGTLSLWETSRGLLVHKMQGFHYGPALSVYVSSDGRLAISGGEDSCVYLWDVAAGSCLCVLPGHRGAITSVYLSFDGSLAVSGSTDGTIRVWRTADAECLAILRGHEGSVTSVCLSFDKRIVVSGSSDKTLRIWDVASAECIRVVEGHSDVVTAVSLSADRRLVLSGSADGAMKLWELDWELEAHDLMPWDDTALPYLSTFLTLHTPYAGELSAERQPTQQELLKCCQRQGKPIWNEKDFQRLIWSLQYAGYGWLRPEGVRRKLGALTAGWQGLLANPGPD